MVTLTGKYRELYEALQERTRADLSRMSGTEVSPLPENPELAKDISGLSDDAVTDLLKPFASTGRVW